MTNHAAGVIDSRLYRDMFAHEGMRSIFSDEATLGGWLKAESALAHAEAEIGVLPAGAFSIIERNAIAENFDLDSLRDQMNATGHPLAAMIKQLEEMCGDAGSHVHFGATTQDIMDTGAVLQIRSALDLIEQQLDALVDAASALAKTYKTTVMAARTHGQHAVPTTFGFKVAVIVDELRRHQMRLNELKPRLLTGSLHGAAGTLATLGTDGASVRAAMMARLGLASAAISRHTARDCLAECVFVLSVMASTAAKFANEVVNLQRSEIAEVAEPAGDNTVGSSTMPQKRNPMTAQTIVAIARLIRRQPAAMLEAMQQEHERDFAAWQVEWAIIPETFVMTSAVIEKTRWLMAGLHVDKARMRSNLEASDGLINAEAVMMLLAPAIGRDQAHDLVAEIVKLSASSDQSFLDALSENELVARHLSKNELAVALEPEAWLGEAIAVTEQIIG